MQIKPVQDVMWASDKFNLGRLLNPQSGYIKIDVYILILCHVISDAKLSHYFLFSKVKDMFLTLKSFRKQNQNIKQKQPLLECRKTSTVKYTSL